MPDTEPESDEPKDAFELFARSFGAVGIIASWVLAYFFILTPWEAATKHAEHVVYSITAIGITTFSSLWSVALVVGGVHGSRLVMNLKVSHFGWRQTLFVFAWAIATFGIYVLLQMHLRRYGYAT
ncbi:MAG: hypothetical protein HYV95_08345 [Opitutae bacterium]|nr:hypothetical protein [Opitutae bacterium]